MMSKKPAHITNKKNNPPPPEYTWKKTTRNWQWSLYNKGEESRTLQNTVTRWELVAYFPAFAQPHTALPPAAEAWPRASQDEQLPVQFSASLSRVTTPNPARLVNPALNWVTGSISVIF